MLRSRVVLIDDHALVRAGFCALLGQTEEFEVVAELENGRDAVRSIAALAPDIILMDLTMPGMNGIEAITEIRRRFPAIRILVVTLHREEEYVQESLRAGANGYILKEASQRELLEALRTVLGGKTYLSPDISGIVVNRYLGGDNVSSATPWLSLTLREREVLKRVAEGNTNKHIAEFLNLSPKTVEKHRSNLMHKLGLHNASLLTAYAIEKGLLGSG